MIDHDHKPDNKSPRQQAAEDAARIVAVVREIPKERRVLAMRVAATVLVEHPDAVDGPSTIIDHVTGRSRPDA